MKAAIALALAAVTLAATMALAQVRQPRPQLQPQPGFVWPEQIKNRQVLPVTFGGERLRQTMSGLSRSLGVRCTFCHVGEEGAPLTAIDFESDANPHKNVAREMLRMVTRINRDNLRQIPGLTEPVPVTCYTCHRGERRPAFKLPEPPSAAEPTAPPVKVERGTG